MHVRNWKKCGVQFFSNLEISIFLNLSKIYFEKVPKLPKEFLHVCTYYTASFSARREGNDVDDVQFDVDEDFIVKDVLS